MEGRKDRLIRMATISETETGGHVQFCMSTVYIVQCRAVQCTPKEYPKRFHDHRAEKKRTNQRRTERTKGEQKTSNMIRPIRVALLKEITGRPIEAH